MHRNFKATKLLYLEIIALITAISTFLFFYTTKFEASPSVIAPHAQAIINFWVFFVSIRLIAWKIALRSPLFFQKIIGLTLLAIPFASLIAWYLLVVLGLAYWGRIITWDIIKAYGTQPSQLIESFETSKITIAAAIAVLLTLIAAAYKNSFKHDFCRNLKISRSAFFFICLLGITIGFTQILRYSEPYYIDPQEPLGASFFKSRSLDIQSHVVTSSPILQAKEDRLHKTYLKTEGIKRRNLIVFIGDALRSDHLSVYGYDRNTTPNLEKISRQHQTFFIHNTKSICAESSCGLMGLASSRPLYLFVRTPLTLHEVLRKNGYNVKLILSGDHTNFYGLKESYGVIDEYFDGTNQEKRYFNDDYLLLDKAKNLEDHTPSSPVMLQFHLMSSHGLGIRHEENMVFQPYVNYYKWPSTNGRSPPKSSDISKAINHYDNGVRQFDEVTKKILEILEYKGYLQDAIVVFTADHGEMLGEKGNFGHQFRVEESALSIPFIFQRRGYSGEKIQEWGITSQIDIAPTILEELNISIPESWKGIALQNKPSKRSVHFQQAENIGFYLEEKDNLIKYYKNTKDNKEFTYDVTIDPHETANITQKIPTEKLQKFREMTMHSQVNKAIDDGD